MINWMYFPQNNGVKNHLKKVIEVFELHEQEIDSYVHNLQNNLTSDEVLAIVCHDLEKIDYIVEKSKKANDLIRVPVLYGVNGAVELAFEVDAYSENNRTVIEVEAGRAVTNYQFLKDFYECCMMQNVDYFVVAVKNVYRSSKDFEKVCAFFRSLYVSNRVEVPLKGVLVIGY